MLPWRGGSNEYPQSMFLSKIRQIGTCTTVNPRFTNIKAGLNGVIILRACYPDGKLFHRLTRLLLQKTSRAKYNPPYDCGTLDARLLLSKSRFA